MDPYPENVQVVRRLPEEREGGEGGGVGGWGGGGVFFLLMRNKCLKFHFVRHTGTGKKPLTQHGTALREKEVTANHT